MPTQVQRRQSEPIPITQKSMQQHQALRLALGSILTPKRPSVHQNSANSRPTSGAASPAVLYAGTHSPSGSHTPIGSPPSHLSIPTSTSAGSGPISYYPPAHGPNSSEHLHPYHPYSHPRPVGHTQAHGHSHTHLPPPSRLGPGRSSPSNSPTSSAPNSSYPSPNSNNSNIVMHPLSDIEPLSMPPPIIVSTPHIQVHQQGYHNNGQGGIDPPPPTPSATYSVHEPPTTSSTESDSSPATIMHVPSQPTSGDHNRDANSNGNGHASGRGTPRAKFLETLQGKSAWDALIHGSFS